MTFLEQYQIDQMQEKLVSDPLRLGKIYKAKKSKYIHLSVNHSLVEGYYKNGWEDDGKPLKTKTKIKKNKDHFKQFEDDIWCQFYELGYRTLNYDENFYLPFSKQLIDKKQIDVIAINEDTVLLVECKSSDKLKKAPSFKEELDLLGLRMEGYQKSLEQMFGNERKVKFIFATRNLRLADSGSDIQRIENTNSFYYSNNTYDYINNLILKYKKASIYQFLGLILKNELINSNRLEIPAVKGKMGNINYYMFSIEPSILLKMGFILHRTRANESEFPTYQRLLVPNRLASINKFINEGGYFPNSIIINFNTNKRKLIFEAKSKEKDSISCIGTLKIPNSYGIAYIIDGQHRVYGYANCDYAETNTIPVVAFDGLDTSKQLEIFMDINQNQKAVSPDLRLDLEEDLFWESDRADSRLKALRSSIVKKLANTQSSSLYNKITVSEDKAILKFKPFIDALSKSTLLPTANGNKYVEESLLGALYDTNNHNHSEEMYKSGEKIYNYIVICYDFVEQHYPELYNKEKSFILSNRGTFPFISIIGKLNQFETARSNLNKESTADQRLQFVKPYLESLLNGLNGLSKEEEDKYLSLLGAGVEIQWLRLFQNIINSKHPKYNPEELIDWRERQDDELQNRGRKYGIAIEKFMKTTILSNLSEIYGNKWELEIGSIKRECVSLALKEDEKHHKENVEADSTDWKDMFTINDYKDIIKKHYTKEPKNSSDFINFQKIFSIDTGEGVGSIAKSLKWISKFNSYRNLWAHEGTKSKRLNKEEVVFLENIYNHFYN